MTDASKKHIAIVGAGPGGLAAAMLLASRGFRVSVFEREEGVGGRNAAIKLGGFKFDTGPTFLMMKFVLDRVFAEAGRKSGDYLAFTRLDPMYRLVFGDFAMDMTGDREVMRRQIARHFPGQESGLDSYYRREETRFGRVLPCLQRDYSGLWTMANPALLRALPHLSLGRSVYDALGRYFGLERLRLAFTFQERYLGMSPWQCPGAFALLSFAEHAHGVWHVKGGLSCISEAMARVAAEHGAAILTGAPVRKVILDGRKALGVELANGERVTADEVVINADFGHAMATLFEDGVLKKYSRKRLEGKKLSCSTFMLYLGMRKTYNLPHHTIVLADGYHKAAEKISANRPISDDLSFHLRNASATDPTLAPAGKSALYVLVPVANQRSGIDWEREKARYRTVVLRRMEASLGLSGLEGDIERERMITPRDWEERYGVYRGAAFGLAHNPAQMLYFRPHNRFEEAENVWLAGCGTHPGSGLAAVCESGRISANLISRKHGVNFGAAEARA